jgi:DNA-binding transcriptional LysR family regulator
MCSPLSGKSSKGCNDHLNKWRDMELNQLRVFCAVVEKKSFSRASEAVFLSQPSVSLQIRALEQELDTRLLDRQGREVLVTRSGKLLYGYAKKILQLADEAKQSIEQLKGLIMGEIIIGASTIPGEYILPDPLAEFKGKYPGIKINLAIGDTKGIIQKVLDNAVEIGFVGQREGSEKLVFNSFATEKLVLITPVNPPLLTHDQINVGELKKVPFILRESGSGTRGTVERRLREIGVRETDLNIVMRVGSTAAVKKAVESGAGVSIISERAIGNEIKLGLLKKVPIKGLELQREFFTVYRRGRSHSPATKALLKFLEGKRFSL